MITCDHTWTVDSRVLSAPDDNRAEQNDIENYSPDHIDAVNRIVRPGPVDLDENEHEWKENGKYQAQNQDEDEIIGNKIPARPIHW